MEDFYRDQRRRFDVLMDGAEPVGGQWNFDDDNREPPPEGAATLGRARARGGRARTTSTTQVRADLDRDGPRPTVGRDGPRLFAVTPAEAWRALTRLRRRTGCRTSARTRTRCWRDDWAMAHSLLSVPLNLGLLHPLDVVRRGRGRPTATATAPLASRRGLRPAGPRLARVHVAPVLALRRRTTATQRARGRARRCRTGGAELDADAVTAACLHDALDGVRDRGWTHHIQRLMVLGNYALQRGYRPATQLTDWFREPFVDGFDWVMPPNVIGMSQHADGGVLATKPYASGGAYINRMSDHCGDCAFDPRKRVGDDACPFTAGYWAFDAPPPRPAGRQQPHARGRSRRWSGWPISTPCWSRRSAALGSDRQRVVSSAGSSDGSASTSASNSSGKYSGACDVRQGRRSGRPMRRRLPSRWRPTAGR